MTQLKVTPSEAFIILKEKGGQLNKRPHKQANDGSKRSLINREKVRP